MVKVKSTFNLWKEHPKVNARLCDHLGCEEEGEFRAPKNRSQLREYHWFCLEHVREYNKSWDFYKGMNQDEILHSQKSDVTWGRPTWPLGARMGSMDHICLQDGLADEFFQKATQKATFREIPKECRDALAEFNLSVPFAEEDLKGVYKKLAKQFHPDHNKGCKLAEERLKTINQAYSILKKFLRT